MGELEARSVLRQIASAIELLWNSNKVHRDIKPANILVDTSGKPVLIDFGLVRHLDLQSMTVLGGAPGTPGYASPEQARGLRNLTFRSDIFSLGVTIYEAIAGRHPFHKSQDLINAGALVIPLDQLVACSPELATLVGRMISHRPILRPSLTEIQSATT
jgi:serine/threonine protein kinase